MTRVTVDKEMREKLLNFTKPLELCDESGSVLGKMLPSANESDSDVWEDLTPDQSDEEIERAIESGEETYSTEELIEQIKNLRGR